MSPTATTNNTTMLHPLEVNQVTFTSRRNSSSSISSEISEEDEDPIPTPKRQDLNQLLSQFDSQPDMVKLIQLCKEEEDRRRQEETKMKLKEYQVLRQLQHIQERKSFQTRSEFNLQLPPLSHN